MGSRIIRLLVLWLILISSAQGQTILKFATLPASPGLREQHSISDAPNCPQGSIIGVGGGFVTCPVFWNGASWIANPNTFTVTSNPEGVSNPATYVANGTATMATAAINSGACASLVVVTATGVLPTDTVIWSHTGTSVTTVIGELIIHATVSTNQVGFLECNPAGGGTATPGPDTINWRVLR